MPQKPKPRRPTEAQVKDAILAEFEDDSGVIVASLPFGRAHVVGVIRLTLDVQVKSSRSLFQPVERIVPRTIGQFFLIVARQPPKDDDEFFADAADLEWAEGVERESGATVVIATSGEYARMQLRHRGLPL